MNCDPITAANTALTSSMEEHATFTLQLERDVSDSFVINVESKKAGVNPLKKTDLIAFMPAGSNWTPAIGWRSFLGIPKRIDGNTWLLIAIEGVRAHSSRGAYPVLWGYLFPTFHVAAEGLRDLAALLKAESPSPRVRSVAGQVKSPQTGYRHTYGVIRAASASPADHVDTEVRILEAAASAYECGERLTFRTLLLSENELHGGLLSHDFLCATVPSLEKTFSRSAQRRISLRSEAFS